MKPGLWLFLICFLLFAHTYAQSVTTRIMDGEYLIRVKENLSAVRYQPAYKELLKNADRELTRKPYSVMDKEMMPPSGDKHDYVSMGPYWWPDPSKPDGLPYIRKDGQRNPELKKLDRDRLGKMMKSVGCLALAYYFSEKEIYAQKAVEVLRVWFLNPVTRMNPNLNYGQYIPGRTNGRGRGEGCIDVYGFVEMTDAIELLSGSKAMKSADRQALQGWFRDFVQWLQTSDVAAEERDAKNNHGLAYDVQLVCYALYTGQTELADELIRKFPVQRIFPQVQPDGKQPLELARTVAFSYSWFNISHMLDMVALARTREIPVYDARDAEGRSVTAAIDFLVPYVGKTSEEWPYKQIKEWDEKQNEACWLLRKAACYAPDKGYLQVANQYDRTPLTDVKQLLIQY